MGRSEIRIQFEKLTELSERLKETAGIVEKLSGEEGIRTVNNTKSSWIGEGADFYVGKEIKAFEKLADKAERLKELSEELYETANRIYKLEQTNVGIAVQRFYE